MIKNINVLIKLIIGANHKKIAQIPINRLFNFTSNTVVFFQVYFLNNNLHNN